MISKDRYHLGSPPGFAVCARPTRDRHCTHPKVCKRPCNHDSASFNVIESLYVVRPHAVINIALISTIPWPGQHACAAVIADISHRWEDTSIHGCTRRIKFIIEWEEVANVGDF